MDVRTIQIANTKTQRRYTLNTAATTLGELQDEMSAQGIDFTGMTFTEGISKTQLLNRESLLPANVMYKGQPTNNLVMLLTNTTKQISSGAMDRKEAYRIIKERNLQDAILDGEGTNYTRVKTDILEQYINYANVAAEEEKFEAETEEHEEEEKKKEEVVNTTTSVSHPDLVNMIELAAKYWSDHNALFADDLVAIGQYLMWLADVKKKKTPNISDNDIDDMIASI